jgi:hypothetical protein
MPAVKSKQLYGGLFAKSARGSVTPGFVNNTGVNFCNESLALVQAVSHIN